MTPSKAKQIIKQELESRNLPYTKLSAKTVGFSDLARGSCIFVHIHGWQSGALWAEIKAVAKQNGFCIE